MVDLRVVDEATIRRLVPRRAAAACIGAAFAADAPAESPLRTHVHPPGGTLLFMPAWTDRYAGVKLVGVAPTNSIRGLPAVHAAYLLLAGDTLRPLALLDGHALTGLRTAAVSAFATDKLARADARHLVLFGSGGQATEHLHAMLEVRPIARVSVVTRTPARAEALIGVARAAGAEAGLAPRGIVAEADIVCTCTTSTTPVFDGAMLAPGAHVNAIGSYTAAAREVDDVVVARARIFVETRAVAMEEAGDLVIPMRSGTVSKSAIVGELRDLARGTVSGRGRADEITLFKSVGLALEDLAIAVEVYERLVAEEE